MRTRADIEKQQNASLAPFAMRASESRGRPVDDGDPPYRALFQRDRDRIIHCTAFRRLEYKTQVFVSVMEGDHYRNRLTHTMEVTQIARTIARALGLNEDLVEVLALAHDLGHGPFGHSGEDALNEVMQDYGGFNHNIQGLRIVDLFEQSYPDFHGLNLTYETREGFTKNLDPEQRAALGFALGEAPTLEVQLVEHADEIAYDTHDLEDSLVSKTISEEAVRDVAIWRETEEEVCAEYDLLSRDQRLRWRAVVRRLIAKQSGDLIAESEKRIAKRDIHTLRDVRERGKDLINFSADMTERKSALEKFLFKNFYKNPKVRRHTDRWQKRLQDLFLFYRANPNLVPEYVLNHPGLKQELPERIICDYVAGMTDRFAERMWKKFCSSAP